MRISFLVTVFGFALCGCGETYGPYGGGYGGFGPEGPAGPAGPINVPPQIESIAPLIGGVAIGAAANTWVITGQGFDQTLANDTVFFGASKATVTAATTNRLTVIKPFANSPAADLQMDVTVEVANQLSNAASVSVEPDGTVVSEGFAIWRQADQIALAASTLFVFDSSTGSVYDEDPVSKAITLVAESHAGGLGAIQNIFSGPFGALYLEDEMPVTLGGPVIFRVLTLDSPGHFSLFTEFPEPAESMTFDTAGNLYFLLTAAGEFEVEKVDVDNTVDATFVEGPILVNNTAATAVGSLVAQGGTLYAVATFGTLGTDAVITLSTTNAAQGRLALNPTLSAMNGVMVGDGANLFVLDGSNAAPQGEISRIDEATGTVTPYSSLQMTDPVGGTTFVYPQFTGMAINPGTGVLFLAGGNPGASFLTGDPIPNDRIIRFDSATTANLEGAGLAEPTTILLDSGGGLLVGDIAGCFNGGSANEGPLFSFKADGTVVPVTRSLCIDGTVQFNGSTLAFADRLSDALETIDPATGAVTTVASLSSDLDETFGLAVDPATGDYYVLGQGGTGGHSNGNGSVARVTAAGAVTADFASFAGSEIVAGTVVGSRLIVAPLGNGFQSVPLATGGTPAPLTSALAPLLTEFGGMTPDGKGGFYAADLRTAQIYDIDANGVINTVTSLNGQLNAISITTDAFGDILFADANDVIPIGAILP